MRQPPGIEAQRHVQPVVGVIGLRRRGRPPFGLGMSRLRHCVIESAEALPIAPALAGLAGRIADRFSGRPRCRPPIACRRRIVPRSAPNVGSARDRSIATGTVWENRPASVRSAVSARPAWMLICPP